MPLHCVLRSWRVSTRERTLELVGVQWWFWATLGLLVGAPLVFIVVASVFSSAALAYARGPPAETVEEDCLAVPVADEEQGTGNSR